MTMSSNDVHAELRRRCQELAERVATLHWDLGGLTYEMAIRDHFRLDVLVRKAAELQEADAELGEVELPDEAAATAFIPPAWAGADVTGDARYANQSLALHGLPA